MCFDHRLLAPERQCVWTLDVGHDRESFTLWNRLSEMERSEVRGVDVLPLFVEGKVS